MPTSPFTHVPLYVDFLFSQRPTSILDIGLGNGKLGFIARDLLDTMLGERYRKETWQIRIDGIEIFEDYIQEHQKSIYNQIYIGDAYEIIDRLDKYDMVVLGDVLEHFEKDKGRLFLQKCFEHCNKSVALFIPLGPGWTQPAIYGNPYETHRSFWEAEDFIPMSCRYKIYKYQAGYYGAFHIEKEAYLDYLIKSYYIPQNSQPTQPEIRSKYEIERCQIDRIDLRRFDKHIINKQHRKYFFDTEYKEHYHLIAYLGTLFNNAFIFDIGTNLGYSAVALSYNPNNRIISYDIVECKQLGNAEELSNIEYCIGNVLEDSRLLSSPLIMLDTNHDGSFEMQFYHFLKQNRYRGLLFLDDIHLNDSMERFWEAISEPKEDLTDLGHWSGSGLVEFS